MLEYSSAFLPFYRGRHVTCPLHGWHIGLEDGKAAAPDEGCRAKYSVEIEQGIVFLRI